MKYMKIGLLAMIMVLGVALFAPAEKASAWVNTVDPISSWIVLDGLFQPGIDGVAPVGVDPISSWIVLDGLFQPGIDGVAPLGTNRIASWIVLDGLFQPGFIDP